MTMSNDLDLFDYMNPDKPEPIYAGTRRTDPEEVKLVVDAELQIAHGRPGVKPNLFKRTNGAAVLSFETSSERDYNAMRSAFDGFRRRFKIKILCRLGHFAFQAFRKLAQRSHTAFFQSLFIIGLFRV